MKIKMKLTSLFIIIIIIVFVIIIKRPFILIILSFFINKPKYKYILILIEQQLILLFLSLSWIILLMKFTLLFGDYELFLKYYETLLVFYYWRQLIYCVLDILGIIIMFILALRYIWYEMNNPIYENKRISFSYIGLFWFCFYIAMLSIFNRFIYPLGVEGTYFYMVLVLIIHVIKFIFFIVLLFNSFYIEAISKIFFWLQEHFMHISSVPKTKIVGTLEICFFLITIWLLLLLI
jgi:hypothetical protein